MLLCLPCAPQEAQEAGLLLDLANGYMEALDEKLAVMKAMDRSECMPGQPDLVACSHHRTYRNPCVPAVHAALQALGMRLVGAGSVSQHGSTGMPGAGRQFRMQGTLLCWPAVQGRVVEQTDRVHGQTGSYSYGAPSRQWAHRLPGSWAVPCSLGAAAVGEPAHVAGWLQQVSPPLWLDVPKGLRLWLPCAQNRMLCLRCCGLPGA